MNNPEIQSALCAACPNRNVISRKLAELGVLRASQTCEGPDTVKLYDISGSIEEEPGSSVVTVGADLRKTDQRCTRDELTLKHGQKILGVSEHDPKTHLVGKGTPFYVKHMQVAVDKLGDEAVEHGAQVIYPSRSRYYRKKSLAIYHDYLVEQGLVKPGKRYIRKI